MTKIEWTHRPGTKGESWNMIAGCTKVQPECQNCYALRDSWRIMHNPRHPARYDGVAEMVDGELRWTGRVNVDWDAVEQPRHWREPRTVFVASMADLFHEDVPFEFVDAVFGVIEETPQHIYLVLTKRSDRMVAYWRMWFYDSDIAGKWQWPANCWAGVSAGKQNMLMHHLTNLAQLHGPPVKFVSAEPLLEQLNLRAEYLRCPICGRNNTGLPTGEWRYNGERWEHCHDYPIQHVQVEPAFNWVAFGGESGTEARPIEDSWLSVGLMECGWLGVPAFVKQFGSVYAATHNWRHTKGADPSEWPDTMRVREWPR